MNVDDYTNLVLLCSKDHTIADADPATWTVEKLHQAKRDHEAWVRTLPPSEQKPIRILPQADYWTKPFYPAMSGKQLWELLGESQSYKFGQPVDCTAEEDDFFAAAFDEMKDWSEALWGCSSLTEQRTAEKSLQDIVDSMMQREIVLMGRSIALMITGGVGSDSTWYQAEIQAWRADHLIEALTAQEGGR